MKNPVAGSEALTLLDGITELRAARGRKIVRVDLVRARPSDEELLAMMLGRSGKLRAPALIVGTALVVGYNSEMMDSVFRSK